MHVNLLRTGVGIESVKHLYDIQSTYHQSIYTSGDGAFLTTKNTPTRANEIINGGSIYWIIKRQICARQLVEDIQTVTEAGQKFCLITLNPEIILTTPVAHKHIQGWRYLSQDKAPTDIRPFTPFESDDDIDPEMEQHLKEAGLI